MAKVNIASLVDWKDGDVVTATKYKQERQILVTAINDNEDKNLDRYTKQEADDIIKELAGTGRTNQTVKGNWDLIQDLYNTRYSKTEADLIFKNKQDQLDVHRNDISDLFLNKTDIHGDFQGTWFGKSLGEASESLNGGRLDYIEPALSKLQSDVYNTQVQVITLNHTLNSYPLVHVTGEANFGVLGFGEYGFGTTFIRIPVEIEYETTNKINLYFKDDLGVYTISTVNSTTFTITFTATNNSYTIKLI